MVWPERVRLVPHKGSNACKEGKRRQLAHSKKVGIKYCLVLWFIIIIVILSRCRGTKIDILSSRLTMIT